MSAKSVNDLLPTAGQHDVLLRLCVGRAMERNALENESFDRKLTESRSLADPASVEGVYFELQQMIHDECPTIIRAFASWVDAARQEVKGFVPNPTFCSAITAWPNACGWAVDQIYRAPWPPFLRGKWRVRAHECRLRTNHEHPVCFSVCFLVTKGTPGHCLFQFPRFCSDKALALHPLRI
ncbi:hypothetical protein [Mesorhizobium sp. M2D.F.Ca.ET.223.01.1.1]|uniref:hypothetical protein n=1 Tax=Mesorhizobium sp. M2D.F.Ca.ET.223.01.1.1 TaxID=2563940 RepID=UPI00142E9DFF|nr:hypothetical protein [Mesorhizobium sp. M2D.F.Ca.ET.223.01.1.1]